MPYESDADTAELGLSSAKVASFVTITQISSVIISGLMVILIARMLGPADYGIYTLAYSVAVLFSSFGVTGVAHYVNKQIPHLQAKNSKEELAEMVGASMLFLLLMCIVFIAIGVVFSGFIASYVFHSSNYVGLVVLSLLSMAFIMQMFLEYNILIGLKDGFGCAATFISGNLAMLVASVAFVALHFGPAGVIYGTIAGSLVGMIVGIAMINRHTRININLRDMGKRIGNIEHMVKFSLVLSAAGVLGTSISGFAVMLLGAFSLPAIVGSFGVASRIGTTISAVIAFVGAVLIPMFSTALEKKDPNRIIGELYHYSIYFGVLFSAPALAYLAAFPDSVVNSVFPSYTSAHFYIPLLSFCILLGIVGVYATSVMISFGKVNKLFKYTVAISVAEVALLFVLVPFLSAYGVIIAFYLFGSLALNYLGIRFMRKELGVKTSLGGVYRIAFASILLLVVLLPVNLLQVSDTLKLVLGLALTLIFYPALIGITGALGQKEMGILRSVGEKTPAFGQLLNIAVSYTSIFVK